MLTGELTSPRATDGWRDGNKAGSGPPLERRVGHVCRAHREAGIGVVLPIPYSQNLLFSVGSTREERGRAAQRALPLPPHAQNNRSAGDPARRVAHSCASRGAKAALLCRAAPVFLTLTVTEGYPEARPNQAKPSQTKLRVSCSARLAPALHTIGECLAERSCGKRSPQSTAARPASKDKGPDIHSLPLPWCPFVCRRPRRSTACAHAAR